MEQIRSWWRARVEIPRWMLTLMYAGTVALGIVAIIIGIPTFEFTTFEGYTVVWGISVTLFGVAAGVGTLQEKWEPLERWTGVGLLAWLVVYSFFAIVAGRSLAGIVIVIVITSVPLGRIIYLLTRTGLPAGRPAGRA